MCRRLTVCTLACVCAKGGLTSGCMLGKTTFFVANQANLEDMPAEKLSALEAEYKKLDEENKMLAGEVKTLGAGECRVAVRCVRCVREGELSRIGD